MREGRLIYLVGPSGAGGENHVALSEHEFLQRRDAGCFALHWQSHGLHYGIGREIDLWLRQGLSVVVNGSRAHAVNLAEAAPRAEVVEVTAAEATIRLRLLARGREGAAAVDARLARNRALADCPAVFRIVNEVNLDEAALALLAWVQRTPQPSCQN